ncbi:hypothetical protein JCGZ_23643 [Jatropha curcas]|uniref:Uncharacterized protein n=1 Tax=Jatropha curcas TaxID=180498 RepID=A0A067L698_JATCU|nr:hypothetical protein JCGZ_23643 [Jatropha curcas]
MQNAPLMEQQQATIVALSHAVAERPCPTTLAQNHIFRQENGGLTVTNKDSAFGDSQVIEAVLVNTNQTDFVGQFPQFSLKDKAIFPANSNDKAANQKPYLIYSRRRKVKGNQN